MEARNVNSCWGLCSQVICAGIPTSHLGRSFNQTPGQGSLSQSCVLMIFSFCLALLPVCSRGGKILVPTKRSNSIRGSILHCLRDLASFYICIFINILTCILRRALQSSLECISSFVRKDVRGALLSHNWASFGPPCSTAYVFFLVREARARTQPWRMSSRSFQSTQCVLSRAQLWGRQESHLGTVPERNGKTEGLEWSCCDCSLLPGVAGGGSTRGSQP